jgi:hypothetical protein
MMECDIPLLPTLKNNQKTIPIRIFNPPKKRPNYYREQNPKEVMLNMTFCICRKSSKFFLAAWIAYLRSTGFASKLQFRVLQVECFFCAP